jgi:hypothetical protein
VLTSLYELRLSYLAISVLTLASTRSLQRIQPVSLVIFRSPLSSLSACSARRREHCLLLFLKKTDVYVHMSTLEKCVKLVINKNYTEMNGQRNMKLKNIFFMFF